MHTTKREEEVVRQRRRKHPDEFKASVVAECARPGVSIARVALSHGLNANLLRKWVLSGERLERSVRAQPESVEPAATIEVARPSFVALPLEASNTLTGATIDVEVRRGPLVVKVSWPMGASAECGGWLRELLR
ncbi:MAG: transposase [Burkholderiales bacterium]